LTETIEHASICSKRARNFFSSGISRNTSERSRTENPNMGNAYEASGWTMIKTKTKKLFQLDQKKKLPKRWLTSQLLSYVHRDLQGLLRFLGWTGTKAGH